MGHPLQGLRAVARVLIQNEAGALLLCRSRDGKAWVPPGGTVDEGETLAIAAAREALEEAGIAAEIGPLVYVQEFRPASRPEHVIEVAFRAQALAPHPTEERAAPAGPSEAPWSAWTIQDPDGPRRLCRWFTADDLRQLPEPVYPAFLKDAFWNEEQAKQNPYLGLVQGS
jgi:8-oxo-dGTP diphosphatase